MEKFMDFSKIKKILSLKNISLSLVLMIVFGFLFFPFSTSAQWWRWPFEIVGGVTAGPMLILIGGVFAILILLGFGFVWVSGALLNLVTSPVFYSWGYTQNPIVGVGLNITKHFVNMGLVVVLIFIALATALKIKEYTAQKTLIRLIAVALLVNFAPVICGLIVDASNIVMNFFLIEIQQRTSNIIASLMEAENAQNLAGDVLKLFLGPFTGKLSVVVRAATLISLYFFAGFAFLFFAAIFFLRYVAIWLLTILAPLAFVAWILPATKKFWDKWWEQLIQWSIIGIPMAFFLYLATAVFGGLSAHFKDKITPLGVLGLDKDVGGLLDRIFPYYVVFAILYLGFFIGLQTSAMGASGIIDFAKTKGKAGAKWAARKIPAGTMAATAGAARGLFQKTKEGEPKLGAWGRTKATFKGAATYEGREKGRESMGRILEKAHLLRPGAYETARRKRWKIEEEVKRLDALPTDRLHEILQRKAYTPAEKKAQIATFEVLAKRSSLGGGKHEEKEKELLPMLQSFGADTKQALKARPDWAPELKDEKGIPLKISKVVAGTSPRDFTKNTQAEALKNANVIISMDTSKIRHMGAHGSSEQKKALSEGILTAESSVRNEISQKIKDLKKAGKRDEAKRIIKVIKEIESNPNLRP